MLKSITLKNFKSFGSPQEVLLEPITVLVGPNNSGKSNLLSVGRLVREVLAQPVGQVGKIDPFVFHMPPSGDGETNIGWTGDEGHYVARLTATRNIEERAEPAGDPRWTVLRERYGKYGFAEDASQLFLGLQLISQPSQPDTPALARIASPLARSHDIKLSLDALRADSPFAPEPLLAEDGTNLAAVINLWRGGYPTKAMHLDELMHSYVPEVKQVLALPIAGHNGTAVRLWFEHTDGNRFDAAHVSDGVLYFTGLVAHVLEAGPGALILIEEPENSIHPRRLHDIVELLRKLAHENGCQFIVATHSPVFLDEFRDDPDAILLFRRDREGTVVRRLTAVPKLREALGNTNPGDMLASGFFNEPF